jgi:hypothetical protein
VVPFCCVHKHHRHQQHHFEVTTLKIKLCTFGSWFILRLIILLFVPAADAVHPAGLSRQCGFAPYPQHRGTADQRRSSPSRQGFPGAVLHLNQTVSRTIFLVGSYGTALGLKRQPWNLHRSWWWRAERSHSALSSRCDHMIHTDTSLLICCISWSLPSLNSRAVATLKYPRSVSSEITHALCLTRAHLSKAYRCSVTS